LVNNLAMHVICIWIHHFTCQFGLHKRTSREKKCWKS
jgi:hypothetical protein